MSELTVGELIEHLSRMPPDLPVELYADALAFDFSFGGNQFAARGVLEQQGVVRIMNRAPLAPDNCGSCWRCREEAQLSLNFMILCVECGNKRCPHANDHRLECHGSNEPGQPLSAYEQGSGAATSRRFGWG